VNPLSQLIEAALFSSARPLTLDELGALDPDVSDSEVKAALEQLREHYDFDGHGVEVVELGGGYQIVTRPALAAALERAQLAQRSPRLTAAMLETLAVIAYRQPVGRAEIEEIRGVNGSGVLRSLQERGLIEVVGRSEGLGRPLLYGTTPLFLELLGMPDLMNLPRAEEFSIALQPPRPETPPEDEAAAYVEAES
jgi:segregation and condensation protein B